MLIYLIILAGFLFLIKGADWLVDGASAIAKKFNVPDLVIGLTIVAFGTSAPELLVNITASLQNNTDIAIGNILGSNIVNIFLILGVASVIFPLTVAKNTIWKEIPLSLLAAGLAGIMVNDRIIDNGNFSGLTRIDGLVFLSFFLVFLYYTYGASKNGNGNGNQNGKSIMNLKKSSSLVMIGLVFLMIGGKLVVDGATSLALAFGVSEFLIGLTIVAIGTSLPELVTSAIAAYKKNADIAVGNIVGSNIFNIFFILGISATINPLPFKESGNIDIIVTVAASLLLFVAMFIGKKHMLKRWQGGFFIAIYALYITFLVMRG